MFCKKCGKYVQPTEKQCPYCGEIMEDTVNNQADNGTGNASEDFGETKIFDDPKEDFGETKIFGNLDIDDDNVEEIPTVSDDFDGIDTVDDEFEDLPDEIQYEEEDSFDFPEEMEDENFVFEDENQIDEDEEFYDDDSDEYDTEIPDSQIINQNKKMNIIAIAVSAGIIIVVVVAAIFLSSTFGKTKTEETTAEETTTVDKTTKEKANNLKKK